MAHSDSVSHIQPISGWSGPTQMVEAVAYVTAVVVMAVGTLGFYEFLSERAPWLASAGVAAIALAVVGIIATLVLALLSVATESLADGIFLASFVALLAGFLLIGAASFQIATPSRTVGLLLLAAAALFVVYVVVTVATGANVPDWATATFAVAITLITLALGALLRIENPSPDQSVSVDTTT